MTEQRRKIIAVEEHFVTPAYMEEFMPKTDGENIIYNKLCTGGDSRIVEMDEAGITMQVLSLNSPGVEQLNQKDAVRASVEVNEYVHKLVSENPDRFRAFMTIPTVSPEDAIVTLKKAKEMRFAGVGINGRIGDKYLDDPKFGPILEEIEALGLPIYLHPCRPAKEVVEVYYKGAWSDFVSDSFSRNVLGWHIETAIHLLRMIFGGIFDKYPGLKVAIGHLGEGLPFFFQRIIGSLPKEKTGLDRSIGEYLNENVYYTFGGFNYNAVFNCLAEQTSIDHIIFSTDYPYRSMKTAADFLDQLPLDESDKRKIAFENAQRLFYIPQ